MSTSRRNPAVLASVLIAGLAVLLLVTVLWTAGEDELPVEEAAAPDPEPEPEPDPEPEPEPEPDPVRGVVDTVDVQDLSVTGTKLYGAGSSGDATAVLDQDATDDFAAAMVAVVDEHLVDLQVGGDGTLDGDGLTGDLQVLRTVGPDGGVGSISYEVRVGARDLPEWGRVVATLTLADGTQSVASFVFTPGEPPRLLAVRR
ncbi:hypothetical protein [Egicoccus sp. AB-alg2]|uniref:hypothetical protein n=1 Tax=Egicoccus sp. AB-alg2 TaxID=3242693 RepID=UPI00359ECAF5